MTDSIEDIEQSILTAEGSLDTWWPERLAAVERWLRANRTQEIDQFTDFYGRCARSLAVKAAWLAIRDLEKVTRAILDRSAVEDLEPLMCQIRGAALIHLDDLGMARSVLLHALEAASNVGDHRVQSQSLGNLGYIELREGHHERAKARFREAVEVAQAHQFYEIATHWLSNLTHVLMEGNRDMDRAEAVCRQHLALAEEADLPLERAKALNNQAALAYERGNFSAAIQQGEAALALLDSKEDDARLRRIVTGGLALAYIGVGRLDVAAELLFEKLEWAETVGSRSEAQKARLHLASIHRRRGEYAEALELYRNIERELDKSEQTTDQDRALLRMCKTNRAIVLLETGDILSAKNHFLQRLAFAERDGDSRGIIFSLTYLGKVETAAEQPRRAIDHYLAKALEKTEAELPGSAEHSRVLGELGDANLALGEFDEALAAFERQESIAEPLGDLWNHVEALKGQATISAKLKRWSEAAEHIRCLYALFDSTRSMPKNLQSEILPLQACCALADQDFGSAEQSARAAIEHVGRSSPDVVTMLYELALDSMSSSTAHDLLRQYAEWLGNRGRSEERTALRDLLDLPDGNPSTP